MNPPSPDEVRAARIAAGLTQEEAAALVYLGGQKRWGEAERGVHRMHPACWELFCIKTGYVPGNAQGGPRMR